MDPNLADDQAGATGDANAKRRRGKGEAGEGNYVCGCGKVYLSYPALYTHIKTKHDGVTPEGTIQPQTSNKSGRGRPKKGESGAKAKDEEEKETQNENNDNQIAYGGILNYLKILELEYKYDDQTEGSSIVSAIPDNFDLVAKFPTDILRPNDYAPVLAELENITKSKKIGTEEIDEESGLKTTNMNRIFSIFIYLIGRHLKEKFYREFVFFLMMYRRALNEVGWKVKEGKDNQGFISETKKETEFCAQNNAEYAPDISNDFITEKWAKYVPQYSLNGFKVLGGEVEAAKNAVFLTLNFCNWLSLQGYTDSYLSINEEETA